MEKITSKKSLKTAQTLKSADLVQIGMCAAITAICSWIVVPSVVPFTLQTFGVFFSLSLLKGRKGMMTVVIYLLLGAVGLPVFQSATAGLGVLFGPTGGYLLGFLAAAGTVWLTESLFGDSLWVQAVGMVIGLLVCYAFGSAWFWLLYSMNTGPVGLMTVLGWCVFPFLFPDLLKMGLALFAAQRLKKHVKRLG